MKPIETNPARSPLRKTTVETIAVVLLSLVLGCPRGGAREPRDEDFRALTETRVMTLIGETLSEANMELGATFAVDVAAPDPLRVDVRVADSRFGIEWVSAQDRANLGDDLPAPPPGGELQILPGHGEDEDVEVLLLDAQRYRYHPERDAVYEGAASSSEAEDRVRRDVHDFLEYARGQM